MKPEIGMVLRWDRPFAFSDMIITHVNNDRQTFDCIRPHMVASLNGNLEVHMEKIAEIPNSRLGDWYFVLETRRPRY